jgi:ABC-type lipoprotein release transport system permease subunit
MWLPFQFDPNSQNQGHFFLAAGRLKPGITIASFLFGVKWWDPIAFITVPVILTITALLAVWIPALRASRLNPVEALRTE